uniref:NB-ARC domain-containing protein n=1 Tax=Aegilops tauschii subsp. strangulata TaxID=200361 RepID=A0A452XKP3_AEGTS
MLVYSFHGTYYKDGIKKRVRKLSRVFPDKIHYQIAKDVKGIKLQLKEILDGYERHKIKEILDGYERHKTEACSSSRSIKLDPRYCMIHKDATELVGVDGPRNDLVNWLIKQEGESAHQQKVVSIVGCAGLGKTTIAKQVYDKFGINFEYRAFVSVTRCPDIKKILNCILCQLHNREYSCNETEDSEYSCDEIEDSEYSCDEIEEIEDSQYSCDEIEEIEDSEYSCDEIKEIEDSEYSCDENQYSELTHQIREFLQDKRYVYLAQQN